MFVKINVMVFFDEVDKGITFVSSCSHFVCVSLFPSGDCLVHRLQSVLNYIYGSIKVF